MKWFRNPCRSRRREISLFATGALPEQDRPEMERHLAACSSCRSYCNEIKALAAPLAGWEKNLAQIEPTQVMRTRWAGAVQASTAQAAAGKSGLRGSAALPGWVQGSAAQAGARGSLPKNIFRNVWREMIWPCRRAWVGLAAVWLALLAVNARLSDPQSAGARSSSAAAMVQSWEEQTRVLAELTQPGIVRAPVNTPAAPFDPPRPRSAREQEWQIV
jgi:anti-sigma factor RsiW